MYAAVHNLEPECFVSALGIKRIKPRVGSHFETALKTGPLLRCGDKPRSDLSAPVFGRYIPTLDETHGMRGIAAVGVRSEAGLNKSQEPPC